MEPTKAQHATLLRIEQIRRDLIYDSARTEYGYGDEESSLPPPKFPVYSLDQLASRLAESLKEIEHLVNETKLSQDVFAKAAKELPEALYDIAVKRGNIGWAAAFAVKYNL